MLICQKHFLLAITGALAVSASTDQSPSHIEGLVQEQEQWILEQDARIQHQDAILKAQAEQLATLQSAVERLEIQQHDEITEVEVDNTSPTSIFNYPFQQHRSLTGRTVKRSICTSSTDYDTDKEGGGISLFAECESYTDDDTKAPGSANCDRRQLTLEEIEEGHERRRLCANDKYEEDITKMIRVGAYNLGHLRMGNSK